MLLFIPQVNKKARDGLKWVVLVFAVLSLAVAVGCSDEPKVVEKIVEVEEVVVEERPVEVVVTATPVPKSEATATTTTPTSTQSRASTPAPDATAAPTSTPVPLDTPAPTGSPTPIPTPTVPPTPTPVPIKEVNFTGIVTATNLPSQVQVVFSLRGPGGTRHRHAGRSDRAWSEGIRRGTRDGRLVGGDRLL